MTNFLVPKRAVTIFLCFVAHALIKVFQFLQKTKLPFNSTLLLFYFFPSIPSNVNGANVIYMSTEILGRVFSHNCMKIMSRGGFDSVIALNTNHYKYLKSIGILISEWCVTSCEHLRELFLVIPIMVMKLRMVCRYLLRNN